LITQTDNHAVFSVLLRHPVLAMKVDGQTYMCWSRAKRHLHWI